MRWEGFTIEKERKREARRRAKERSEDAYLTLQAEYDPAGSGRRARGRGHVHGDLRGAHREDHERDGCLILEVRDRHGRSCRRGEVAEA